MRTSGLGVSLLLVAVGAILTWAVTVDAEGIDINMVGVILMIVGLVGLITTLILTGSEKRTIVERDREVVVDREISPDPEV